MTAEQIKEYLLQRKERIERNLENTTSDEQDIWYNAQLAEVTDIIKSIR